MTCKEKVKNLELSNALLRDANKRLRKRIVHMAKERQQHLDPDSPVRWN
jgi:hypothetical protein